MGNLASLLVFNKLRSSLKLMILAGVGASIPDSRPSTSTHATSFLGAWQQLLLPLSSIAHRQACASWHAMMLRLHMCCQCVNNAFWHADAECNLDAWDVADLDRLDRTVPPPPKVAPFPRRRANAAFQPSQSKVKRRRATVMDWFTPVQTATEQNLYWQLYPQHVKGKTVNWKSMAVAWNQVFSSLSAEHGRDIYPKTGTQLEQYSNNMAFQLRVRDVRKFYQAVRTLHAFPGQVHASNAPSLPGPFPTPSLPHQCTTQSPTVSWQLLAAAHMPISPPQHTPCLPVFQPHCSSSLSQRRCSEMLLPSSWAKLQLQLAAQLVIATASAVIVGGQCGWQQAVQKSQSQFKAFHSRGMEGPHAPEKALSRAVMPKMLDCSWPTV